MENTGNVSQNVANSEYQLHKYVFQGNVSFVSDLLKTHDVAQKDVHGNTPLHLAVMLGQKECIRLLVDHNAPVNVKNSQGWNCFVEAVSYGDREIIVCLLRKLKQQQSDVLNAEKANLISMLNQLEDFHMVLKWDFKSWVPLISRMLPSDTCTIHKKGSNIRVDLSVLEFKDMKWERGDFTCLFMGNGNSGNLLILLDNNRRVYQNADLMEKEVDIEDHVDLIMSSSILQASISTEHVTYRRLQSGWISRQNKTEKVGRFLADSYCVEGLSFDFTTRSEHLPEDSQHRDNAGGAFYRSSLNSESSEPRRTASLPPPTPRNVSFEDYITAAPGQPPVLGRTPVIQKTTKDFKATLAMSEHFPLTVDALLNVLNISINFKHLNKLREFVQMKLPPGFPVKIDFPVLPTVMAHIRFEDFEFQDNIDEDMFEIPTDYSEDRKRFWN